ncbi:hypothetical protein Vadar_023043 [Vaccinium darrowii]|uniref:Uncharacterized protein n=1 Tax=Vaccinium darrowii TaxID=229202 RepID=A0ACB7YPC5_9ERIC|nr:hypothetical protein Vadar_023043 [Vaccinium darrowii]
MRCAITNCTLRLCSGNTCGITDEVYFPRDIWVDILTRLPGKMVGQCKCVCKRWQAGPAQDSIAIVNPITKEIVALPPYNNPWSYYTNMGHCIYYAYESVSFGFDPSTTQYKVVNIYWVHKRTRGVSEFCHCECEIFTLGSQSWRKIDIVPPASRFEFGIDGVCLGGVLHWRNFADNPLPFDDEIVVTFDLKDERFRVVSLPRGPTCMARLVEVGGHLAACLEYPEHEKVEEEELWILNDYDNWVWVKERIMLPRGFVGPKLVHTIGSIQAGEILLHNLLPDVSPSLEIYYYGRNKRSLRKIEIAGHPGYEHSITVFNYVENLFSLRDV